MHVEHHALHLCHKPDILLRVTCLVSECICFLSSSIHASTSACAPPLRSRLRKPIKIADPEQSLAYMPLARFHRWSLQSNFFLYVLCAVQIGRFFGRGKKKQAPEDDEPPKGKRR